MRQQDEQERAVSGRGGNGGNGGEGRYDFGFTYDDTGATTTVTAPNGWTLQRVVDEAYQALGETPQAEDRVEFGGRVLDATLRATRVKDFVQANGGQAPRFHIVSRPGGA